MSEFRIIGRSLRKVDAVDKVTGRTQYADDLSLPRMLHCKLLRSHLPHARIQGVETSAAATSPGVSAVITGRDLPIPYGILPVSQDEHALCLDRVRFLGDPVAAVAAETEEQAAAACERIRIDLEPLASVSSVEAALANPEPRIHEYGPEGNIQKIVSMEFGDVEERLRASAHVREDLLFYGGNTHLAMEEHASLADWSPEGRLTLWSSTQTPHYVHRALAKVLELPPSQIRVVATPNGGGFGGKTDPFGHEIAVCKLAMITGRPVKICLTREEVFYCHRGRHPTYISTRTGVDREGRIQGMHVRTVLDGGAYGSYGVASTFYTGALQTATYHAPTYRFDGARVFTNKAPCGPKRGHGTPQGRFALEVQLDKIAEDIGMDPAELRMRNLVSADSITTNYLSVGTIGLGACIEAVTRASGWKERFRQLPPGRGLGLACSSYLSGAGLPIYYNKMPHSGVSLKLDRGGGVVVFCGSTDVGQGSDSILAYLVAEVLGISLSHIRVVTADTDLTPVDLGSYSSRVTLMTGNAALEAAGKARDLIAATVADELGAEPGNLVFEDDRVFAPGEPERGLDFPEAVRRAETRHGTLVTTGSYSPPPPPGRHKGAGVGPSPAYSYSAAVAEVEVELDTGLVRVDKIWIAHDAGRVLNRQAVIGQVEGSVYMGLGEALMEEMVYRGNRNVVQKAPSMLEYKSPTMLEMCEVETHLIEDPDPAGPFGAKEVGQGPLLPIPPAVANAVYDAVGVRIDEVPITPDKVLSALTARGEGGGGRYGPAALPSISWPEPTHVAPGRTD